jgi:hypothetical protein
LIILCFHLQPKRLNVLREKGFYITKIHLFQVKEWFGFPCLFVVFSKSGKNLFGPKAKQY